MSDTQAQVSGERGYYVSPLTEFPGHVQFPWPLKAHHYKTYVRALDVEKNELDRVDRSDFFDDWRAAFALLSADNWHIKAVPWADVTVEGEQLPLAVLDFVRRAAADYIAEALAPKQLREQSETMS